MYCVCYRWLRDTLLSLYDNYLALSSELSSEDNTNTEDPGTDSGMILESRTGTKTKINLKERLALSSLEDAMKEVILKESSIPDQILPTFDSCVR